MSEEQNVLTKEIAEQYIRDSKLDLRPFTALSDDAAQVLAKSQTLLIPLTGLATLSEASALALSSWDGTFEFGHELSLTDNVAAILGQSQGAIEAPPEILARIEKAKDAMSGRTQRSFKLIDMDFICPEGLAPHPIRSRGWFCEEWYLAGLPSDSELDVGEKPGFSCGDGNSIFLLHDDYEEDVRLLLEEHPEEQTIEAIDCTYGGRTIAVFDRNGSIIKVGDDPHTGEPLKFRWNPDGSQSAVSRTQLYSINELVEFLDTNYFACIYD